MRRGHGRVGRHLAGPTMQPRCRRARRQLQATGSYGVPTNALLALREGPGSRSVGRRTLEYKGTIRGHAIEGVMNDNREGGATSVTLLDALGLGRRFLMFLDGDGRELKVMETPEAISPEFYVLKRA